MVRFRQKGDFSKLSNYLNRVKEVAKISDLDRFGKAGVDALAAATPVDTGKTADAWSYEITHRRGVATISFHNSNINKGVSIAIILQYGHGTRNGGYVEGVDYINPALQPLFEDLAEEAWKEVTRV